MIQKRSGVFYVIANKLFAISFVVEYDGQQPKLLTSIARVRIEAAIAKRARRAASRQA